MLGSLYTAIAAELLEINAYVVPLVGEHHVRRNDPPPRMIMYPVDDTFDGPSGPGGNPRPIHDVLEASELVIHGTTLNVVTGMRDQFVNALRRVCKRASQGSARAGRYVLGKGKWTRNTLIAKNGFEYKLTFSVVHPIVDRRWSLTDPDAPAGPENPPQEPNEATYEGDQANTYPVVAGEEVELTTDVGHRDDPPAADNVTIVINPVPPPPEDP